MTKAEQWSLWNKMCVSLCLCVWYECVFGFYVGSTCTVLLYVHMCVLTYTHLSTHVCGSQRSTPDVLLYHLLFYSSVTDPLFEPTIDRWPGSHRIFLIFHPTPSPIALGIQSYAESESWLASFQMLFGAFTPSYEYFKDSFCIRHLSKLGITWLFI